MPKLEFNQPLQVKHIQFLQDMNKKGDFTYFWPQGRTDREVLQRRLRMATASSGSLASIRNTPSLISAWA
ncbi:glycerol-3-phosphate transporter periplasmic binding protein [Serratia fonticola]|uniref:Glycerol-3-phosphate transporter periplasmic binding protein n=1 Tax=Serratia fonticola TaxID=47917 RepID=A0A4U9U0I9_SERFO|nr:glycerol-3-phosphate transporter periplasmic binding protein [Serratia fonticola]